jgi:uncharacterized protein (TIGR02118 family)
MMRRVKLAESPNPREKLPVFFNRTFLMRFCLFLTADASESTADDSTPIDVKSLETFASGIDGLGRVVIHVPVHGGAQDPYLHALPSPPCALQFYFDDLATLEKCLAPGGAAHALLDSKKLPSLAKCSFTQQVMAVRRFPVPNPPATTDARSERCTYLVSYEGPADDLNAWLTHYISSHPPIMARFPGIREIEIYTRLDYCSALPVPRSEAMQRNKVVFDSAKALDESLSSPVRHEMRADFKNFPPFKGDNLHFPMISTGIDFV